MVFFSFINK